MIVGLCHTRVSPEITLEVATWHKATGKVVGLSPSASKGYFEHIFCVKLYLCDHLEVYFEDYISVSCIILSE